MAFTQNLNGTFPKQPRLALVQILPADTTAQKTVITAGASGNKVISLTASSSDTASRDVQVSVVRAAVTYILLTTTVAITAGFIAGTPPVDLLALIPNLPRDQDGQPFMFLESGDTLVVSSLVAVTAAKVISVFANHAEF